MPLAHTEGGLSASMSRGMKAAATSGGFRTYVLHDRMTRASCFICKDTEEAVHLARWLEDSLEDLRSFLAALGRSLAVEAGEAPRGEDARRRADVPRALGLDDRRRVRAEHDDPQQLRAEHGLRDAAGAGEAGAGDPRGEHGRRQEAVLRVLPVGTREDRARRGDAGRRDGAPRAAHDASTTCSSSRGQARTAPSPPGCSRSRSRRRRRSQRSSPAPARTSAWSAPARWRTAPRTGPTDGGLHATIRFPGLEVGTVGGGTTLPYARSWLALLDCAGTGKVHRFAQIVAAAALALEISASAAMATAGSENFFKAHHERGGLR